jgi:glycosyltransferase involved in cell wall biosynthesis
MTSFIVPAHNEEAYLGRTLRSIHDSAQALGEPYEVVVVDDASTDRTAAVARDHEARVVAVNCRQIAAVRNAGARTACGDVFYFVDADTVVNPEAVRAGLAAIRAGAIGGGCVFRFDCPLPAWARVLYPVGIVAGRLLKVVGGCCLFCTREAFQATGGFPETHFAAEELAFIRALKRRGRFVVPPPGVVTSGRKLERLSAPQLLALLARVAFRPRSFHSREGLEIWYGEAARATRSPAARPGRPVRAIWCD